MATLIPKPSGNGLLPGLPIDGDTEDKIEIPTICIEVDLNGETNKYVNFAKLAEKKYGPFAFNPHLYREHKRLAADMSGEEMSESESNMEDRPMSGMDGDSTADTKPKKRAKRKPQDSYDAHDPFIDDSEMMFEEQAAATKDGFFVYSGPLIPVGVTAYVERYGNLSLGCRSVTNANCCSSLGLMGQQSVVVVVVVVAELVEEGRREEELLNLLLHGRGKHRPRKRKK